MYTTVTKVRQASGFVGNSNVTDAFILGYILQAQARVDSYIRDAYTLPLPKYHTNTITFSGTGSSTATLTIVIDGVSYAISIISTLTASAAADLFRQAVAASASATFTTDGLGNGAVVYLYSNGGDDSTQVDMTSGAAAGGITPTEGTVTEIAVPMVESLTTQVATALLFIVEYGPESEDTDKDGYKLLSLAETALKAIRKKEIKLYDFDGDELPTASTRRLSFWPTTASQDDGENDTANKFTRNKVF